MRSQCEWHWNAGRRVKLCSPSHNHSLSIKSVGQNTKQSSAHLESFESSTLIVLPQISRTKMDKLSLTRLAANQSHLKLNFLSMMTLISLPAVIKTTHRANISNLKWVEDSIKQQRTSSHELSHEMEPASFGMGFCSNQARNFLRGRKIASCSLLQLRNTPRAKVNQPMLGVNDPWKLPTTTTTSQETAGHEGRKHCIQQTTLDSQSRIILMLWKMWQRCTRRNCCFSFQFLLRSSWWIANSK